jgi:hypothetical protein
VDAAGIYTVTVRAAGQECEGTSAPITIAIGDTVKPVILSERGFRFCDGDAITLRVQGSYREYRWSTGQQTPTIEVTRGGQYWVEVTDDFNCTGRSTVVRVDVDPNPIEIVGIGASRWQFDTTAALAMRCDSLRIRNSGQVPLVIGGAMLARNVEFSIPLSQLPVVIPPGEERWLVACFLPTALGELQDTLRISDAADYCTRQLVLVGVCGANRYAAPSSCAVGVQGQTATFTHAGLVVVPPYPNPASQNVAMVVQGTDVRAELIGLGGNAHRCECHVASSDGTSRIECTVSALPSGYYALVVHVGLHMIVQPIAIVR